MPTFLGAHAVPAEYQGRTDAYVDLIVDEMLPTIADLRYKVETPDGEYYVRAADFCDVFCEAGVFDVAQSSRILVAARELGMGLKIHADEFEPIVERRWRWIWARSAPTTCYAPRTNSWQLSLPPTRSPWRYPARPLAWDITATHEPAA